MVNEKTFEKLMIATFLVLILLVFVASFVPTTYDSINDTDPNETDFRDIPGGDLVADNVTLIILGLLLVAVAIGYIRIATSGVRPRSKVRRVRMRH